MRNSACERVLPTQHVKTFAGCTPISLRSLPYGRRRGGEQVRGAREELSKSGGEERGTSSSLARSSRLAKRSSSREITSEAHSTHLQEM